MNKSINQATEGANSLSLNDLPLLVRLTPLMGIQREHIHKKSPINRSEKHTVLRLRSVWFERKCSMQNHPSFRHLKLTRTQHSNADPIRVSRDWSAVRPWVSWRPAAWVLRRFDPDRECVLSPCCLSFRGSLPGENASSATAGPFQSNSKIIWQWEKYVITTDYSTKYAVTVDIPGSRKSFLSRNSKFGFLDCIDDDVSKHQMQCAGGCSSKFGKCILLVVCGAGPTRTNFIILNSHEYVALCAVACIANCETSSRCIKKP